MDGIIRLNLDNDRNVFQGYRWKNVPKWKKTHVLVGYVVCLDYLKPTWQFVHNSELENEVRKLGDYYY